MNHLLPVTKPEDILPDYRKNPIGDLIEFHNLDRTSGVYKNPQILLATCMDNRIRLRVPDCFAFIIRTGGINLKYSNFHISYAIAMGHIKHVAVIGHNDCGMLDLHHRKREFIEGMSANAGWIKEKAVKHFDELAMDSEIHNECENILQQTKQLRALYPIVQIAPLMYLMEDQKLYFINE
jgi:carbonic anhydrase